MFAPTGLFAVAPLRAAPIDCFDLDRREATAFQFRRARLVSRWSSTIGSHGPTCVWRTEDGEARNAVQAA